MAASFTACLVISTDALPVRRLDPRCFARAIVLAPGRRADTRQWSIARPRNPVHKYRREVATGGLKYSYRSQPGSLAQWRIRPGTPPCWPYRRFELGVAPGVP